MSVRSATTGATVHTLPAAHALGAGGMPVHSPLSDCQTGARTLSSCVQATRAQRAGPPTRACARRAGQAETGPSQEVGGPTRDCKQLGPQVLDAAVPGGTPSVALGAKRHSLAHEHVCDNANSGVREPASTRFLKDNSQPCAPVPSKGQNLVGLNPLNIAVTAGAPGIGGARGPRVRWFKKNKPCVASQTKLLYIIPNHRPFAINSDFQAESRATTVPQVAKPPAEHGLLYGQAAAQRATFKLARFSVTKKAYVSFSMECKICAKKGHTDSFCPAARTAPTPEERSVFADTLIVLPREDIQREQGYRVGHVCPRTEGGRT